MRHNEIGTSDDLEILEICLPAGMGTVPVDRPKAAPTDPRPGSAAADRL